MTVTERPNRIDARSWRRGRKRRRCGLPQSVVAVTLMALGACGGGADRLVHADTTVPTSESATATTQALPAPSATTSSVGGGSSSGATGSSSGSGPVAVPAATPLPDPAPGADPTSGSVPTPLPDPVPGGGPGTDAAANGVVFTPYSFNDPMARGITAFSILVPRDWRVTGSIQWRPLFARAAQVQTHVEAPGLGVTLDWLPIEDFIYLQAPPGLSAPIGGNYQGKVFVPPITDPVQFVQSFWMPGVLAELQGAQVESVTPRPDIADVFLRQAGGQGAAFAYRIRYSYDLNAQPWERDVSFTLHFVGDASTVASWFVYGAHTEAAPAGQLDQYHPLLSTVMASRTTTPEWEATQTLVAKLFYQGLRQEIANEAAFGQLLTQYEQQTAQLQQQVIADRQASEDHNAEVFRETLGGVQAYDDPVNGRPVELPLGYQTYWVNEKGEYLAADQASFDPNTLNDGTWQRLTPRP